MTSRAPLNAATPTLRAPRSERDRLYRVSLSLYRRRAYGAVSLALPRQRIVLSLSLYRAHSISLDLLKSLDLIQLKLIKNYIHSVAP